METAVSLSIFPMVISWPANKLVHMKACPSISTSVLINSSAPPTAQSSIPPMALASCKVLPKPLYPVYRSTSTPTGRLQQFSLSPGCWQIIIPKRYCTCLPAPGTRQGWARPIAVAWIIHKPWWQYYLAFQSKCGYDNLPYPLLVTFEYERKEAGYCGRTDLPPRTHPIDSVNSLAHVHSGNRPQM